MLEVAQCFWQAGVGNGHSVGDMSERSITCVCVCVCMRRTRGGLCKCIQYLDVCVCECARVSLSAHS